MMAELYNGKAEGEKSSMMDAIVGAVIGSIITLLVTSKCSRPSRIELEKQKVEKIKEENHYKCKTHIFQVCEDTCCKHCLGFRECKYSCGGDPRSCGQSVKIGIM